jgi:uncharacterized protein
MPQMIFVNLPITDLPRARAFYTGLGWTINEAFSDETAACVVVSETIFVMILTRPRFADFVDRPVGDPSSTVSALFALNMDSRDQVDAFAARAVAHGGRDNGKAQDLGFMYSRSLSDPDGNVLEAFWMDPAATGGGG